MDVIAINTVIIGGGHAGVNLACMLELERPGEEYTILERSGALLVKWRNSRWEGFQLNTPAKFANLYGQSDERPDWLLDRPLDQDIDGWDTHIDKLKIKHKLHSNVVQVTCDDENMTFSTIVQETNQDDGTKRNTLYKSKNVVVCNGMFDVPKVPKSLADDLSSCSSSIKQHIPAGFQFQDLAPGNILVVGSAQSGVQISDLLLRNCPKAKIYLCTSAVPGCPRSFQGKDLFEWLEEIKFLTMPRAALDGMPPEKAEAMRYGKAPVTGPFKDISPFSLHRQGVTLLGTLAGVEQNDGDGVTFRMKENRAENLKVGFGGYHNFMGVLKKFADQPDAPDADEWSNIEDELLNENGPLSLDSSKADARIGNVIWCTGWSNDFSWLQVDNIQADMDVKTKVPDVIVSKTQTRGLFYCGFPWIGTLQSVNLVNFNHDAKVILEHLRTNEK